MTLLQVKLRRKIFFYKINTNCIIYFINDLLIFFQCWNSWYYFILRGCVPYRLNDLESSLALPIIKFNYGIISIIRNGLNTIHPCVTGVFVCVCGNIKNEFTQVLFIYFFMLLKYILIYIFIIIHHLYKLINNNNNALCCNNLLPLVIDT